MRKYGGKLETEETKKEVWRFGNKTQERVSARYIKTTIGVSVDEL